MFFHILQNTFLIFTVLFFVRPRTERHVFWYFLNAVDIVVIVNHLMQQRCYHALDVPAQGSRTDVDFMGTAQFGNPCIFPKGKVAVCLWCGLDGDGWP